MASKKKYIIGNWKSNNNMSETEEWFELIGKQFKKSRYFPTVNLEIIVCPPFVFLPKAYKLRDKYQLPIKLGAQDVSPFNNGAYTGAVSARMLSNFVEYIIIGHSERRTHFLENDRMLSEKTIRAKENNLEVIYCIPGKDTFIPESIKIVAYEPVWAIGTGKTDTPENADRVASFLKLKHSDRIVVYGGSVNPDNVKDFLIMANIDGVLPGGASLDPNKFWEIILNASTI